ncbi:hypothetical protein BaRGS_00013869 [Batillaria attramentaria]|uniref:Uncharacterized protein n=1 Tax=Batillaria attramentaria TaxID=370345 RepID=A0ABD0L6N5_9CAEN
MTCMRHCLPRKIELIDEAIAYRSVLEYAGNQQGSPVGGLLILTRQRLLLPCQCSCPRDFNTLTPELLSGSVPGSPQAVD